MYWDPMYLESTKTTFRQPRCAFQDCQVQMYDFKGGAHQMFFPKKKMIFLLRRQWGGQARMSEWNFAEFGNTQTDTWKSVSIGSKFSILFQLVVSMTHIMRHSNCLFRGDSTIRNPSQFRTTRRSFQRKWSTNRPQRRRIARIVLVLDARILPQSLKNIAHQSPSLYPGMFVLGISVTSLGLTSQTDFSTTAPRGSLWR